MTPEPGEMRRMALSSVARGADGLLFFRWRPAHFGAEIYWMGILDHDDVPRRRYRESRRNSPRDIAKIKKDLLGTTVRMDVAIAGADFDNQEAYKTYPMGMPSPVEDACSASLLLFQGHRLRLHPSRRRSFADQAALCSALGDVEARME